MSGVKALLLDVNGTLFSPKVAASAFERLGLTPGGDAAEAWFSRVLRDAFGMQCAGLFKSFNDYGSYHLACMLTAQGHQHSDGKAAMQQIVQAWQAADMYPDVVSGLRSVRKQGIKVAVMTNGSAESIARPLLEKAGVLHIVEPLLDINMAQAWKPHPNSYRYALQQLQLEADQVLMVASHPWDIHGAMQVGLKGAYVQRTPSNMFPEFLPKPDMIVQDFEELARFCST